MASFPSCIDSYASECQLPVLDIQTWQLKWPFTLILPQAPAALAQSTHTESPMQNLTELERIARGKRDISPIKGGGGNAYAPLS